MATGVASSRSPVSATHHGSVRLPPEEISESGLCVFAQPGICGGGTVAGTACKAQSRRFNSDPTTQNIPTLYAAIDRVFRSASPTNSSSALSWPIVAGK
jgi:hypothetical protein